jgi:hypothetical protein
MPGRRRRHHLPRRPQPMPVPPTYPPPPPTRASAEHPPPLTCAFAEPPSPTSCAVHRYRAFDVPTNHTSAPFGVQPLDSATAMPDQRPASSATTGGRSQWRRPLGGSGGRTRTDPLGSRERDLFAAFLEGYVGCRQPTWAAAWQGRCRRERGSG